jgi:hypothetical protein
MLKKFLKETFAAFVNGIGMGTALLIIFLIYSCVKHN